MARMLKTAGYPVKVVSDIVPAVQQRAARLFAAVTESEAIRQADMILIATPDRAIAPTVSKIAGLLHSGQTLIHFSGRLGSSVLQAPGFDGGRLALHPVMTFTAKTRQAIPPGTYFVLEGNRKGLITGRQIVRALRGRALTIRSRDKVLFHAACVFVSNYLVTLIDAGLQLCAQMGLSVRTGYRVFEPLIHETIRNIADGGTAQALSGPIERGDIETVEEHLAALTQRKPKFTQLYEALAIATLDLAVGKKKRGGP